MEYADFIIVFFAALASGFINALAGGGTLLTFPVLLALGISPVAANVTNTIALCPGYFGGTYSQRRDFMSMRKLLWLILPVAMIGGIAGGVLLIYTPENSFRILIPYLILAATIIFAFQGMLKKLISKQSNHSSAAKANHFPLFIAVFVAAVYGGYFGAGLGVILMAAFGLHINESLTRINALKQSASFCINIVAAVYFCFSGMVVWPVAAVMIAGSLCGGMIGGKAAGKINTEILRWIIVTVGFAAAVIYFLK